MTNVYKPENPKPNVIYVLESESEQATNSDHVQCFKRTASNGKRRSGSTSKFKNTHATPPMAKRKPSALEFVDSSSVSITNSSDLKKQGKMRQNYPPTEKPVFNKIKCLKFVVFGCTLITLLVNFGLLALGTFLKADLTFSQFLSENYRQTTETQFTAPSLYKGTYALIILSALAIVISVAGCCGVIQNNVCMLSTHFGISVILFLFQLSVGILWYFRREAIENEVAVALDYMVQHYYQGPGIVQEVLDSLQTIFRCCGNAGCGDFVALRLTIPRTCDLDCYGCRERMFRFLRDGMTVIYIFGIAMLCAELISIMTVMYLLCRLKEKPINCKSTMYQMKLENNDEGNPRLVAEKSCVSQNSDEQGINNKVVYLAYPVHSAFQGNKKAM